MATQPLAPLITIVDSSPAVTEVLRILLEEEGYRTSMLLSSGLRDDVTEVAQFLIDYDPAVVLYDIGVPYEEHWLTFRSLQQTPHASDRVFVVTTTNKGALEGFVGPTEAYEIVGKPFDLEQLVGVVRRALGGTE